MIKNLILQSPSTYETRSIHLAAISSDSNDYTIANVAIGGLESLGPRLEQSMPVGSVEFVREVMRINGMKEPANLSYPNGCEPFLGREIYTCRASSVLGRWFVKPIQTKLFNGFLFDMMQAPEAMDSHDREQYDIFVALHEDEQVIISKPIRFVSEWRYYVDHETSRPIGFARYDPDGLDDAPRPCQKVIFDFTTQMNIGHPYAADFGVTDDGRTILVEVNDFWALGLYQGPDTISAKNYLRLLQARWQSLCEL
ncbi:MAG: hypothetical protein DDT31_00031 [Syntrophomonadaceae bacterium]|nr:hypothetical protein [Bacillota bacterium]